MKNPNRNRITAIASFKPLCVPLDVDQSFADEIFDRRMQQSAAPWERLGLVYLAEYSAPPERSRSDILVNNLTQQIIFRVFLTNRSRKPIEWDQAGFVLLKKIFRRIAKARESAARRWETVHLRGMEHGVISSGELHTALRLLLRQTEENEKYGNLSEISVEKLKRTLTRVLRGISEQPRTNVPPDIRITGQGKALLKLLAVNSGGRSAEVKSAPMVMLIPPTETDAYRTNDDYARQLPPIEYKRNQPREQTEPMPPKRPRVINRRQTQTDTPTVTGRLENFSREEVNRLADKICAQIETRVLRERRRVGM